MKKKLTITDQNPHAVVISMGDELGVEYTEHKDEVAIELPPDFGSGYVKSYSFQNGFGVILTKYTLKKDFHFELQKEMVHPLKLIFNVGDTFFHKLANEKSFTEVHFSEVIIVASTPTNNHKFMIPAKQGSDLFSIEINRKLFENRIIDFSDELDMELSGLFRDANGVMPFSYKGQFSYDIGVMIEEFKNCQLKGMNKSLYLESKAYEIFSSFLEQYLDDTKLPDKRSIFRQNQTRFIKQTAEYIKNNLENLPTVQGLSAKFGLSTNILQNGFRSIYGMSVNEFIQNERLLLAKKLLGESEYSISEITYKIGLNSKSYLSKIFLERYAMTPTEFRSSKQRKDQGSKYS
ncbi:helix-turn-helix transcriptional regulator [Aggregatimonas sangjinii]|uniref:Helix-turn-helix transcriptional regulator n=1 Tax=Aggregatimonas sangjinii TaxID=2583587 RepID=A0A5B7SUE7_9FLAO|nr:AraC family transcriptional regulator [Aggregatimonas sangjinii]QCX00773.1 helix-turn-helix transcriptional regulator [Aggregatimonas sangjinii]